MNVNTIFILVMAAEGILVIETVYSLLAWNRRIYPPPKTHCWQNYSFLTLHFLSIIGFFTVALLDMDTFIFAHLAWKITGGILAAGGLFLAFGAVKIISTPRSIGIGVSLIKTGLYGRSRNPQIVGSNIAYLGMIFFFNSFLALFIGLLANTYVTLTTYAEERWFKEHFGKEYEEYCRRTPRFL